MAPVDPRETGDRVIAAFPATGKSWIAAQRTDTEDSDSSLFSRGPEWPANYIEHVRKLYERGAIVLVSTHAEVRAALEDVGIPFTLAYPERWLRDEYRDRMENRGSSPALIAKVIDELWDEALRDCAAQTGCKHIVLGSGQYLADVLDRDYITDPVTDAEHRENVELARWRREWEITGHPQHSCVQSAVPLLDTGRSACGICGAVIDL